MKNPANKGYHLWVTNITKMDIGIGDLGVFIKSRQTIDLLDYKHSLLSVEKVKASLDSGSLYKRLQEKKIVTRYSEPLKIDRKLHISKAAYPGRKITTVEVEERKFEELNFDYDDMNNQNKFAEEMAESALIDHAAAINIDKGK